MVKKYLVKRYCHDVLIGQIVIEAESKDKVMSKYFDAVVFLPKRDWPRDGDTVCLDITEISDSKEQDAL